MLMEREKYPLRWSDSVADIREMWWILAGAVIASNEVRKEVFNAVQPDDAPTELRKLFQAAWKGDAAGVRESLRLKGVAEEKVIDTIVEVIRCDVQRAKIRNIAENLRITASGNPDKFAAELQRAIESLRSE